MNSSVVKICADTLKNHYRENYGVKLKSSHAHELVASFFGYKSKNAMLSDSNYPPELICGSEVVICKPVSLLEKRIEVLENFPLSIKPSDVFELIFSQVATKLSEENGHSVLFQDKISYVKHYLATSDRWKETFTKFAKFDFEYLIESEESRDKLELTIKHGTRISDSELSGMGQTVLSFNRVSCTIGFNSPSEALEVWTGGFRQILKLKKGEQNG